MENEQILALINKAIQISSGGLMNTQQLDAFIEEGVASSDFLQEIRVETGIANSLDLDTIGVLPKMLRKKIELTALSDDQKIKFGGNTLTPVECGLYQQISYKWLRKALGGDRASFNPDMKSKLEEQVQSLLAKQFAQDIVSLMFNGDTGSTDPFFKILNGILKKADTDVNVHTDLYTEETKLEDVFSKCIDLMPDAYLSDLSEMRFYVNPATRRLYKKQISARETEYGDSMYKNVPVYYEDALVKPVFAVPRNVVVFTKPQNLVVGYGLDMLVERDKDIKKGAIDLVMTSDIDVHYVVSDALVVMTAPEMDSGIVHDDPQ